MIYLKTVQSLFLILFILSSAVAGQETVKKSKADILKRYELLNPASQKQKTAPVASDHIKPELHWTPRNTGTNKLPDYNSRPIFIDSQNRYYFNINADVFDGETWELLDVELPGASQIIENYDGSLWMLSNTEMHKYNADLSLQNTIEVAELDSMSNRINKGIIDQENRLWVSHVEHFGISPETGKFELLSKGGFSIYDTETGDLLAVGDTLNSGLENHIAGGGVNNMAVDNEGQVWVAVDSRIVSSSGVNDTTFGGIAVYNSSLDSAYNFQIHNSDLPAQYIKEIEVDHEGNIWVSFDDLYERVAYYDGVEWTGFSIENSPLFDPCLSLKFGSENKLYCSTKSKTMVFDGTVWQALEMTVEGQEFTDIRTLTTDTSGTDIFWGGLKRGSFIQKDNEWSFISTHTDGGLFSAQISDISFDDNNVMWTTSNVGAAYYDGSEWTFYNDADGMSDSYSWRVHAALDGSVWFSSSDSGITYFKDDEFYIYDEYGAFEESILEDKDLNIWMGSFSGAGILQFNGENFIHHEAISGVIGDEITALVQGPDDAIYAGSEDGIARYDGNEWAAWTPDSTEFFGDLFFELASDFEQNLWIIGDSLMKWDGINLTAYAFPIDNFMPVFHVEPDPEGNIWVANYENVFVFRISDNSWQQLEGISGLPVSIKFDNNGDAWIASYNNGLYKYDRSKVISTSNSTKEVDNQPEHFSLSQNYPNPFNPTTKIVYNLPEAGNVTVSVYNLLGEKVATPIEAKHRSAGQHQITFNGSGLSSGLYIYRIESDKYNASKKMLLVK